MFLLVRAATADSEANQHDRLNKKRAAFNLASGISFPPPALRQKRFGHETPPEFFSEENVGSEAPGPSPSPVDPPPGARR
jgi:hypothetical protein